MNPNAIAMSALLLLPLGACAAGNLHRYDDVLAAVPFSGSGKLAIATRDQRPYVVSGDKKPQFVGLSRGGFGNSFDVKTASGKPLADDMTLVLERSLEAKGYDGVPVVVTPGEADAAVAERLRATGAPRAVVLTLREWKSDTYTNTGLLYDVTLQVMDAAGATLAESVRNGKDDLRGSIWNPAAHARKSVPPAFQQKIEQLLADPAIGPALR